MRRSSATALLVVTLLVASALAAPPAAGQFADRSDPVCLACDHLAFEDAADVDVVESRATLTVRADGSGRWHVRNRLADGATLDAATVREAVHSLAADHANVDRVENVSVAVRSGWLHVRYTDPDAGRRAAGGVVLTYFERSVPDEGTAMTWRGLDRLVVTPPRGYATVDAADYARSADGGVVIPATDGVVESPERPVFAPAWVEPPAGPLVADLALLGVGLGNAGLSGLAQLTVILAVPIVPIAGLALFVPFVVGMWRSSYERDRPVVGPGSVLPPTTFLRAVAVAVLASVALLALLRTGVEPVVYGLLGVSIYAAAATGSAARSRSLRVVAAGAVAVGSQLAAAVIFVVYASPSAALGATILIGVGALVFAVPVALLGLLGLVVDVRLVGPLPESVRRRLPAGEE